MIIIHFDKDDKDEKTAYHINHYNFDRDDPGGNMLSYALLRILPNKDYKNLWKEIKKREV